MKTTFISSLIKFCFCLIILIGINACKEEKAQEIVILSTNDLHAKIDNIATFAAVVDSLRNEQPELLLFSAGDNRTGNPVNDQYQPTPNYPMVALMNKVGFQLTTLGNHEFDGGLEGLKYSINKSNFPYLCANATFQPEDSVNVNPAALFTVNGVKIAVIGLIQLGDKGIPSAHPKNVSRVDFVEAEKAVEKFSYLRNQCDVMVLLSHCGFYHDSLLAQQFPEVDVIIGGHSHTLVKQPCIINGVLVTQSGEHLKYLTKTTLQIKEHKVISKSAELIKTYRYGKTNHEIEQMVKNFNASEYLYEIVGNVKGLSNKRKLGSMMCDAILFESGADIAIQNPGGVRSDSLPDGTVNLKDIFTLDPFGNEIITFKMSGTQIKDLLKAAAINDHGAMHVAGINYVMNTKENEIINIEIFNPDGSAFDENKEYTLAMNSYIASSVNFKALNEGESIFRTGADAVIHFLKEQNPVDYTEVDRIKIIKTQ